MNPPPTPRESLSVIDSISLIVGIVIGTSIFRISPGVFLQAGSPTVGMALWAVGGMLSFIGALCYAELVVAYPQRGGDLIFLTQAYGPGMGYLFSWVQLTTIMTGNIGVMAFACADYGAVFSPFVATHAPHTAAAAIVLLTIGNFVAAHVGRRMQWLLAAAKIVGLIAILLAACLAPRAAPSTNRPEAVTVVAEESLPPKPEANWGLAMVFVLYAFGGWNDAAYVAADLQNRRRNVPLALGGGLLGITLFYLAVNGAYLAVLGPDRLTHTITPAGDLLKHVWGERGERFISAIVVISALGAINGMLYSGARLFAAAGERHHSLRWMAVPHTGHNPRRALVTMAAISLILVLTVGTAAGRDVIDAAFRTIGLPLIRWANFDGGFGALLAVFAPVFWMFFTLTSLSTIALRLRDPARFGEFRLPFFPLAQLLFIATCGYMLWNSLSYAGGLVVFTLPVVLTGITLHWLTDKEPLGSDVVSLK